MGWEPSAEPNEYPGRVEVDATYEIGGGRAAGRIDGEGYQGIQPKNLRSYERKRLPDLPPFEGVGGSPVLATTGAPAASTRRR